MGALEELGITREDISKLSAQIDQHNKNHRSIEQFSKFIVSGAEMLINEHTSIVQNIIRLGN